MNTWLSSKNNWLLIGLVATAALIGILASLGFTLTVYLALGLLCLLLPLMFLRPLWGLVTLLVIRPALDIFGQTLTIALPLRENLSINLASVLAIVVIIWGIFYLLKNQVALKQIPLVLPFAILLAVGLVSIVISADRFASFAEWIRWLSSVVIFLIAYDLTRRTAKGRWIIGAILASAIIPLFVGLWQLISGTGIFEISTGLTRVYGTFAQPNSLAFFLILVAAALLIFWQNPTGLKLPRPYGRGISPGTPAELSPPWRDPAAGGKSAEAPSWRGEGGSKPAIKLALVIPAVAVLLILFFTYTRGAWLALIIILIILGVQRWKWKFVIILLIITAVAGLFILFSSQNTRVTQFNLIRTDFYQRVVALFNFDEYTSSTSWRVRMWSDMMTNAFPEKPWLGYGLGMYVPTNLVVQGYLEGALEAHNDYLMLLIETGLIGLAAYVFLMASTLVQVIKTAWRSSGADKKAAWVVAALLIGIFIMSFSDNILRITALQWALWSLVAVVLASQPEGINALAKKQER